MGGNLVLGAVMLVTCVAIQCFFVSVLVRSMAARSAWRELKPTLGSITLLLATVMLIMVSGNLCQVALWAGLFRFLGEFPDIATAFYHSTVNFSTLGYGDIVMSEQRRLLGAFEAANGVLMLGLTTSVLFLVLDSAVHKLWRARNRED